tara:strand:- start:359 stop:583 length:225 start_codon:yes stop_codon:yes gene_type:complete
LFCSFSLPLLIRLTALQSTTGAFLSLRSSDAKKKRPFFLGILPYQANRKKAPKFLPRLQKFLTEASRYTEEKEP